MATIQEIAPAPWRLRLVQASFAGVVFHVEQQGRSGGRRVVLHEYPKRNIPYAEDMGTHAIRYQMTGYLVAPDYNVTKFDLINALEGSTGAPLIDPYMARELLCICERYNVTEVRERGGYCVFEMAFVEVGKAGNLPVQEDSKSQLQSQSSTTSDGASVALNGAAPIGGPGGGIGSA